MDADHDPPFDPARYVFTVRLRCPKCRAEKPRAIRGPIDDGDPTAIRRPRECRVCCWRFFEVEEDPDE